MRTENEVLHEVVAGFESKIRSDVFERVKQIPIDVFEPEVHSVLGALLARQGTLAIEHARAISTWNYHSSPLFIRAMVDVHITAAWLTLDPAKRCKQFIEHGLGQAKLQLEHQKAELLRRGKDPSSDEQMRQIESWINSQKFTFLLPVDVGSWSGLSTRQMAMEAEIPDVYNFSFSSFSNCVHSTWNHICRFNTIQSPNALHRHTFVPSMPDFPSDYYHLDLAARKFDETARLYDRHFKWSPIETGAEQWLDKVLEAAAKKESAMIGFRVLFPSTKKGLLIWLVSGLVLGAALYPFTGGRTDLGLPAYAAAWLLFFIVGTMMGRLIFVLMGWIEVRGSSSDESGLKGSRLLIASLILAGLLSGAHALESAIASVPPLGWESIAVIGLGSALGITFVLGIQVVLKNLRAVRLGWSFFFYAGIYFLSSGISALLHSISEGMFGPPAALHIAIATGLFFALWLLRAFAPR